MAPIGLPSALNFIWGFPPDTRKTLTDNVKLIKKYNFYKQIRTIRPVICYPGCELYYEAIEKGLINGPKDFFDRFKNSDLITINHTMFNDNSCHRWLFDANRELIYDHQKHTNMSLDEADDIIEQFRTLYFGGGSKRNFSGVRHYNKKIKIYHRVKSD